MVVFGIDIAKGGIMSSLLTRSKMFLDNNIDANIITFDYKTDYNSIVKELKIQEKWTKESICIINFIF